MNDFTIEDLVGFLAICFTLTDEEKAEFNTRILDELDANEDNRLSAGLRKDLEAAFQVEMEYLESQYIPEQDAQINEYEEGYDAELERIRPELDELVNDYEHYTKQLMDEYDEEFSKLDKAFDELVQGETASHEEKEIASIHQMLKQKPQK